MAKRPSPTARAQAREFADVKSGGSSTALTPDEQLSENNRISATGKARARLAAGQRDADNNNAKKRGPFRKLLDALGGK